MSSETLSSDTNESVEPSAQYHAQYMVEKALLLLLSDVRPKSSRAIASTNYMPRPRGTDEALVPRFLPMILLLNLWVSLRAFSSLLPQLKVPFTWVDSSIVEEGQRVEGRIRWHETINRWALGKKGFVTKNRRKDTEKNHAQFVAFALEEIITHSHMIEAANSICLKSDRHESIARMTKDIRSLSLRIQTVLRSRYQFFRDENAAYLTRVKRALGAILKEHGDNSVPSPFREYERHIGFALVEGTFSTTSLENLIRWRRQYLACNVWLSQRVGFQFTQRGAVSQLYEMWAFFEVARAARRVGIGKTIQRCFISRNRVSPEFSIGSGHYVYFDFRKKRFFSADVRAVHGQSERVPALPTVFVEWFIRNRMDYKESIVLDTKYSAWDSRETLKVMGYMLNYGVNNGAIVYRRAIPVSRIGGEEIAAGLVRIECENRKTLWLLSLIPEDGFETQNSIALEEFVSRVLVPR